MGKLSLWVLSFEALGLYIGTVVAEPLRSGRIPLELVTTALRKKMATTITSMS